MAGYMALIPFFVAGAVVARDHPLRQRAMAYLNVIGQAMGIGHAKADVEALRTSEGMVDWVDEVETGQMVRHSDGRIELKSLYADMSLPFGR
jgi:hypothetical protein